VANLSDLAAMGARPLGFLWSLAAPPDQLLGTVLGLARGMLVAAAAHGCPLVGGNVTRAGELSLTLTALGAVAAGRALRRSGARPGDRLCVTGTLGGQALARARGRVRRVPQPRLAAGRALAREGWASACIDVSDGLLADLGHLCRASGVGAEVDPLRVPRPRGFAAACRAIGCDPERFALAGGEDYELLFALRPKAPEAGVLGRRLRVPVTEIGRIRPRGLRLLGGGGPPAEAGFRHF
jgi:thiamine-monophosphate kinase